MASINPPTPAALVPELQQYVGVVRDIHVANLCNVAAAAWLAYDICITFPQEVSLVWSNGTLLPAIFGEAMFLMRLYASYQRSKLILVLICCFYATQMLLGFITATLILLSLKVLERSPSLPLPGCLVMPPHQDRLSIAAWAFAMFTTCSYFVLILNNFSYNVSLRRKSRQANQVPIFDLPTTSPLIYSFLRDSAFYFFLVFAGNVMNLVFQLIFQGRALLSIGTFWLSAIYAVSASRLFLNTREMLRIGSNGGEWDTHWFDDIELRELPSAMHAASARVSSVHTPRLPPRNSKSPIVTFAQNVSGTKLSLQRNSFESDRKREPQTPVSMETRQSEEDYELIAVAPWIILERPVELT
ncbi:hypothetical protein L227DRAFT_617435 [Lentinus tigrinus ALCF2SS1-6]|uniref:DUF6533 domain-containing protein n=1 Tax=Lentinus tigrinus ALCF2SS1-6 TaxID=1328759 RepID=A0A5C2RR58_9APHY|nr:hypothetical protein L227DRAFT_617435 [Lentinus tigrinus ALCF2SS1-6]